MVMLQKWERLVTDQQLYATWLTQCDGCVKTLTEIVKEAYNAFNVKAGIDVSRKELGFNTSQAIMTFFTFDSEEEDDYVIEFALSGYIKNL